MTVNLLAQAPAFELYNKALPDNLLAMKGVPFLQGLISTAISFSFLIGSVIFFFMLVQGAITWITSKGETWDPRRDPGPLVMAKKQITHALIGFVLLVLVYVIIRLIEAMFGVNVINITIPTLI